jgi:uncharacterized protein (DUF1697 family)
MKQYIAFLRGINVGGNTRVPMKELVVLCIQLGLKNVRTYINSGNVLFESEESENDLKKIVEKALERKYKKEISIVVRTKKELESILKTNPFKKSDPSTVGVVLFHESISTTIVKNIQIQGPEELKLKGRELYINYPIGMGKTKLVLPHEVKAGTVRNINTLTKCVQLYS